MHKFSLAQADQMAIKMKHKQDVNIVLLLSEHGRKLNKAQLPPTPLEGTVSCWDNYVAKSVLIQMQKQMHLLCARHCAR